MKLLFPDGILPKKVFRPTEKRESLLTRLDGLVSSGEVSIEKVPLPAADFDAGAWAELAGKPEPETLMTVHQDFLISRTARGGEVRLIPWRPPPRLAPTIVPPTNADEAVRGRKHAGSFEHQRLCAVTELFLVRAGLSFSVNKHQHNYGTPDLFCKATRTYVECGMTELDKVMVALDFGGSVLLVPFSPDGIFGIMISNRAGDPIRIKPTVLPDPPTHKWPEPPKRPTMSMDQYRALERVWSEEHHIWRGNDARVSDLGPFVVLKHDIDPRLGWPCFACQISLRKGDSISYTYVLGEMNPSSPKEWMHFSCAKLVKETRYTHESACWIDRNSWKDSISWNDSWGGLARPELVELPIEALTEMVIQSTINGELIQDEVDALRIRTADLGIAGNALSEVERLRCIIVELRRRSV